MIDDKVRARVAHSFARLRLAFGLGFAALILIPATGVAATASLPPSKAPASYPAFVDQMIKASAIADPLQRCLRMPDPPGSHWHAAGVEAYCRYRNSTTLSAADVSRLVAAGKAAEVDKAFEVYLHAHMTDPTQPGLLDIAVINAGFRKATPAMRKTIDAWMRQRPHSAFAVAASAIQYYQAAGDARGSASGDETSDEQWGGMRALARQARRDFDRAVTMTPAVPSMYSDMFALGRLTGDTEYAIAALEKGLAIDNTDLALRITAASMSSRKWGGSEGWLLKLEADAAALAPDHPLLWVAASRAHIEAITNGHLDPAPGARFVEAASDVATATALASLADDARRAGRRQEAVILALESLRFDDTSYWALYSLGEVNGHDIHDAWANDVLRQAAKHHPDDPDVLGLAGVEMFYAGDRTEAPGYIDAAFRLGNRDRWVLEAISRINLYDLKRYEQAAAVADRLIQVSPARASGYLLRASAQIAGESPARYKAIHAYIDRFADDADEGDDVGKMRAYLQAHPEPVAETRARVRS